MNDLPRAQRTRYALIGAGGRASYYIRALATEHADVGTLVAIADLNQGRAELLRTTWRGLARSSEDVVVLRPDRLQDAIGDLGIDRVIVCSPDWTHADVVARSLHAGADVIVEKPLVTDELGARLIADAVAETGRDVTVAFNYRYSPRNGAVKEILTRGDIGRVLNVHFDWMLDTVHGADYFRRWHRQKENSGGLLVHKASHHFDLMNWWLDDSPARVFASGGLKYYGAQNSRARGESRTPTRGSLGAPSADPFRLDMRQHPEMRELYLDHEHEDGYHRDLDPFDEGITIEDSLSALVDYRGGAAMTYSLTAFSPWEGYRVSFTGTSGRLELSVVERGAVIPTESGIRAVDPNLIEDRETLAGARPPSGQLILQKMWEPAREIVLETAAGAHGGGDPLLFHDLYVGADTTDPLRRAATLQDGIRAVAVGIAGNRSMSTGEPVLISDLELGIAV